MSKKIIIFFVFLFCLTIVFSSVIQKEYVLLDMKYENGVFSLVSKSLEKGYAPYYYNTIESPYTLQFFSDTGNLIYKNSFNPAFFYAEGWDDSEIIGGGIILDDAEFSLIIPSTSDGEKVTIIDANGETIFEEDIYDVGATSCRIR